MLSGQRSASGLLAKPTTRHVMVYIRFFLYQGYDILFYREAHCTIPESIWALALPNKNSKLIFSTTATYTYVENKIPVWY
jgi:hypothetical protein